MIDYKAENGLPFLRFKQFNKLPWLGHGFTTRNGGVSAPPFHSFNLGKNTTDGREALKENYRLLLEANNTKDYRIFLTNQVHGDTIQCVAYSDGVDDGEVIYEATDGLMTAEKSCFLMSFYADCTPLFFVDTVKRVVAVSHAGWKGTVKNIGKKTVEQMVKEYGSDPTDILVGIGPSSGICCYEVGREVIDQLEESIPSVKAFYKEIKSGKYLVDIKKANIASIMSAGIPEDNIEASSICTICNHDFFSYRREGVTGRMSGFIYIKPE